MADIKDLKQWERNLVASKVRAELKKLDNSGFNSPKDNRNPVWSKRSHWSVIYKKPGFEDVIMFKRKKDAVAVYEWMKEHWNGVGNWEPSFMDYLLENKNYAFANEYKGEVGMTD